MASSSENLLNYEPWMMPRSAAFTDSFISEEFAQNTDDVLAKAFLKSLYDSDYLDQTLSSDTPAMSPFINFVNPTTVSSFSGSEDSGPLQNRRRNNAPVNGIVSGKITKRKSRASERHKTTFINADPENFRQLVQQVTGVKFGGSSANGSAIGSILKPEPQRPGTTSINRLQSCLPTLDTSSFLLDRYQQEQQPIMNHCTSSAVNGDIHAPYAPPSALVGDGGSGGGLGFDSLSSFPTLESWKVM